MSLTLLSLEIEEGLQLEEVRNQCWSDATRDHDRRGVRQAKEKPKETHDQPTHESNRPESIGWNMTRVHLTEEPKLGGEREFEIGIWKGKSEGGQSYFGRR
jgi:hypothetical protein